MHQNLKIIQCNAFSAIIADFYKGNKGVFFFYGLAKTVKIYIYNLILVEVRSRKKFDIAVNSSGVAAILLSGGTIAYS